MLSTNKKTTKSHPTISSPSVKKQEVDLDVFKLSIIKQKNLEPFLNVFHFEPDNIANESLGHFFGIIEVTDHSEKSSYLPNLITQVLKKEYYSKKNRDLEKSFESALHRANLALADLAQHEIIQWMNNFKAILGVIQNKNFFLTQVGGGKILLIRDKKISDLSRGLSQEDSHPMKTFSDISSGTIEDGDKIVYVNDSFFESFSWEDLKRHIQTFSSNELDNLIKSTLESEAENVGAVILNVKEKTKQAKQAKKQKESKDMNYFGKTEKETPPTKPDTTLLKKKREKKKTDLPKEIKKIPLDQTPSSKMPTLERKKERKEEKIVKTNFPPKNETLSPFEKQPELYIKETGKENEMATSQEKNFIEKIKNIFSKEKTTEKIKEVKEEKEKRIPKKDLEELLAFGTKFGKKIMPSKKAVKTSLAVAASKGKSLSLLAKEKIATSGKKGYHQATELKKTIANKFPSRKPADFPQTKEKLESKNIFEPKPNSDKKLFPPAPNPKPLPKIDNIGPPPVKKKITNIKFDKFWRGNQKNEEEKIEWEKYTTEEKKSLPKTKNHQISFNLKSSIEKITDSKYFDVGTIVIILMILLAILGFILSKKLSTPSDKDPTIPLETNLSDSESKPNQQTETAPSALSNKTQQSSIETVIELKTTPDHFISDGETLFVHHQDGHIEKINPQEKSSTIIESENSVTEVIDTVYMEDLNLIFLVRKDSIHSFSPVTEKYTQNKISLPENFDPIGSGTYLTFLYLFNRTDTQIYRYPRAEGGFGEAKKWLAEENTINATEVTDMMIDENIRISFQGSMVEKYFRGKKENEKKFEDPIIVITKAHTNTKSNYYLLLDKEAGKIYQIRKNDDEIEKEFFNEEFFTASDLLLINDQIHVLLPQKIIQIKEN